jgi:hypothetical protein
MNQLYVEYDGELSPHEVMNLHKLCEDLNNASKRVDDNGTDKTD